MGYTPREENDVRIRSFVKLCIIKLSLTSRRSIYAAPLIPYTLRISRRAIRRVDYLLYGAGGSKTL